MTKLAGLALLVAIMAIAAAAPARAEIDGSAPALCATIETVECSADRKCQHGLAGHVRIPTFLRIDFKKKQIHATPEGGEKIVSAIKALERADGKLILTGFEGGRGWSMVIEEASGGMSLALSGLDASFLVFGACTIP
jgi:hypothetical protein